MEKKKLMIITILSVIILVVLVLTIRYISKDFVTKNSGEITIVLVDIDGNEVKSKEIKFNENDTLVSLITNNFNNVKIENGMLMSIESFETPQDFSTFISIYVDDKMSDVGLKDIKFKDQTKISFIMTKNNYVNN